MSVFYNSLDTRCWSCALLCLWPTPSTAQNRRAGSRSSPAPTHLARASTSNRWDLEQSTVNWHCDKLLLVLFDYSPYGV